MSRYVAQPSKSMPGTWLVDGDYSAILTGRLNEAEASIIAFALNAVAEGRDLLSIDQSKDDDTFRLKYDGPTEGVAPNAN